MLSRPLEFPRFALGIVLLVSAGLALGLAQAQSDTWWHLRAGHDIWADHQVSLVDRYSWTVPGRSWPDHEWLWQAIVYPLHRVGGMPLLAGFNGLLAIGAVLLVIPRRRPTRLDVVVVAAAVPVLAEVWAIRPQVASMFLFVLLVRLVRSEKWIWIPPLMLVWANVHGAVATGGVVLATTLAAAVVTWFRDRSPASAVRARRLALVTAASAAATLATPMGWRLWSFVLTSIGRSKDNNIQEWRSAFHLTAFSVGFWLWLVLVVVGLWVGRRRITGWPVLVDLVTVLVLAPFAVSAIRNIAFFVLAAVPLVAHLLRGEPRPREGDEVPHGRAFLAVVGLVAVAAVASLWAAPSSRSLWRPMSAQAVAAVEACPKPIYNTYNAGGFLIWFAPRVPVFVDNRQDPYPPEIMALSLIRPGDDFEPEFERLGIRCAFVESRGPTAGALREAGWHTAYDDQTWAVYQP